MIRSHYHVVFTIGGRQRGLSQRCVDAQDVVQVGAEGKSAQQVQFESGLEPWLFRWGRFAEIASGVVGIDFDSCLPEILRPVETS
jgi:hypothetical protein